MGPHPPVFRAADRGAGVQGASLRAKAQSRAFLSRSALAMTVTELNVIAALAIIGLSPNGLKLSDHR